MDKRTEPSPDKAAIPGAKSDKGIFLFIILAPLPLFLLYLLMMFLGN